MEAISNAELIDVEAEIAAGRMKRLEDGTLTQIHEDGSQTPILSGLDKINDIFEAASRRDDRAAIVEAQRARQAHEARIKALREGGRIFGR